MVGGAVEFFRFKGQGYDGGQGVDGDRGEVGGGSGKPNGFGERATVEGVVGNL